jgi:hypothetical protein
MTNEEFERVMTILNRLQTEAIAQLKQRDEMISLLTKALETVIEGLRDLQKVAKG